jgi:outer membrane protein OmpA-like peptidoglycan-associated protein
MEEVMRKVLTLRYPWSSLATILLAAAFFMPTKELVAQMPAAGVSSQAQDFTQNVKEVYFPFNIHNRVINPSVLASDAEWLKQHPDAHFWIQSYADLRGDIFYNLVLSYRRAQFVESAMIKSGVSKSQIGFATGWGKLYPPCQANDDPCYQQQRRADIVPPDTM